MNNTTKIFALAGNPSHISLINMWHRDLGIMFMMVSTDINHEDNV